MKKQITSLLAAVALATGVAVAAPAEATTPVNNMKVQSVSTSGGGEYDTTTVKVWTNGKVDRGADWTNAAARSTGNGGNSSAKGCRTVKVTTTRHNVLHLSVAYKLWASTHWCWNRAKHRVSKVSTNWDVCCVDGTHSDEGPSGHQQHHYYRWATWLYRVQLATQGKKLPYHGAYWHFRREHMTNCVVLHAACFDKYPEVSIRSHYDGTYSWMKDSH